MRLDLSNASTEIREHLLQHLVSWLLNACELDTLHQLLTNYTYIQTKVQELGINALLMDYELPALEGDRLPSEGRSGRDLLIVQESLRLSSHVLVRRPEQVGAQLLGRLLSDGSARVDQLLKDASESVGSCRLKPMAAGLTSPGGPLIRTLTEHANTVTGVAIGRAGDVGISVSSDETLKIWDLRRGRALHTLPGLTWISSVAMTPDCRTAISGGGDGRVGVWDIDGARMRYVLSGHTKSVRGVRISSDGSVGVSTADDETIRIWDLQLGVQRQVISTKGIGAARVAIAPDGETLVVGWREQVFLLDVQTGRTKHTLEGHSGEIGGIELSGDGRVVLTSSNDRTLRVWDFATGRELRRLEGATDEAVFGVAALSGDGTWALTSSSIPHVLLRLWHTPTGTLRGELRGHMSFAYGVSLSWDGLIAISGSSDDSIKMWDLSRVQPQSTDKTGLQRHAECVYGVAMRCDGKTAISGSTDGMLIWNVDPPMLRESINAMGNSELLGRVVTLSVDGRFVFCALGDNRVAIWDTIDRAFSWKFGAANDDIITCAVMSDDARLVGFSLMDYSIHVFDVATGGHLCRLAGHANHVQCLCISADRRHLASGSWDGTVKIWDVQKCACKRTFTCQGGKVLAVKLSADGRLAASADWARTVRIWDVDEGAKIWTLRGHTHQVWDVALSADWRYAYSASLDRSIRMWDLSDGVQVAYFEGDVGMRTCAVSGDGSRIIAGDSNGCVHFLVVDGRLPSVAAGSDVRIYPGHPEIVFVPGGEFVTGVGKVLTTDLVERDFWIDRFPVTNQAFCEFLNQQIERRKCNMDDWIDLKVGRLVRTRKPFRLDRVSVTVGYKDHPVVGVLYPGAVAYALSLGKRLPTTVEWEKAARGLDGRVYPWGNEWDVSRSNTEQSGIGDTSPVDEYHRGISPYGCYDMTGNVFEWTAPSSQEGAEPALRGGAWYFPSSMANCFFQYTCAGIPMLEMRQLAGFRCAKD